MDANGAGHSANPRGSRCPSCGGRLRGSVVRCPTCGVSIGWGGSTLGVALQGAVTVAVAVGLLLVFSAWRTSGGRAAGDDPFQGVVASLPTSPPTFTAAPPPTLPPPASTPYPPTPTPLPPVIEVTVQSGDTLYGIAIANGVSLDEIMALNEDALSSVHSLAIGQVLRVPTRGGSTAATDDGDPRSGGELADAGAGSANAGVTGGADSQGESDGVETADGDASVEPAGSGDDTDVDVAEGDEAASAVASVPEEQPAGTIPGAAEPAEVVELAGARTYTVRRGDTLGRIAAEVGVRVDSLVELNALEGADANLTTGGVLILEPAVLATVTAQPALPPLAGAVAAGRSSSGMSADSAGRVASLPADDAAASAVSVAPPLALWPVQGARLNSDQASVRWASSGPLPEGAYYVVAFRDASGIEPEAPASIDLADGEAVSGDASQSSVDRTDSAVHAIETAGAEDRSDSAPVTLVWVRGNATSASIPARLRPALGAHRTLEWSVSVRREGNGVFSKNDGVLLSGSPRWHRFEWAPGAQPTPEMSIPTDVAE